MFFQESKEIKKRVKRQLEREEFKKIETQVHHLKTLPKYYMDVYYHNKKFEVRKNDRDFKVNDIIILEEWDKTTEKYTGKKLSRTIIYILDDPKYVKEGYVILGIK